MYRGGLWRLQKFWGRRCRFWGRWVRPATPLHAYRLRKAGLAPREGVLVGVLGWATGWWEGGGAQRCGFAWQLWVVRGMASYGGGQGVMACLGRSVGRWLFLKLRYKGKSFRWHRRRGGLILRFGHSHLVACPPQGVGVRWRRKARTKIIFFGTNLYKLRRQLARIIGWRPMNIYHGRGLRLARQVVYRKAGKVSAYR